MKTRILRRLHPAIIPLQLQQVTQRLLQMARQRQPERTRYHNTPEATHIRETKVVIDAALWTLPAGLPWL